MAQKDPEATSPHRLGIDFGVPHPILTDSYSCTLITSDPFPVAGGYGSRLFGESWESSNLYWARLADEKGYAPAMQCVLRECSIAPSVNECLPRTNAECACLPHNLGWVFSINLGARKLYCKLRRVALDLYKYRSTSR